MNLRTIFWPWGEIARLDRELNFTKSQRDDFRRIANRRLDRIDTLLGEHNKAHREIASLKTAAQPRDPVTGRMRAKVKG